jgi:hypothetical protein
MGPPYAHPQAPPNSTWPSPPDSPPCKSLAKGSQESQADIDVRDPVLYAGSAIASDEPLFSQPTDEDAQDARSFIEEHMNSSVYAALDYKPAAEDYNTMFGFVAAATFRSTVHENLLKNPQAWWKQERSFDALYGPSGIKKKDQASKPLLKRLAPAPSAPRVQKAAVPREPRAARNRTPAKRTPKAVVHDAFDALTKAASPKPVKQKDDVDFESLPDFSPPVDPSLNPRLFKIEWKGGRPLDLDQDPHRHLLHEGEVQLASALRLSCAKYLCSKRRIFQAVVDAYRIEGKEFRKTDAQQACKLDVNKASKLWEVFHKLGWFNRKYFQQYGIRQSHST